MNRLRKKATEIGHSHQFTTEEVQIIRKNLLEWYDNNKRDLQWRQLATHSDPNIRAYSVLVSEIMLQQTQVTTVKPYFAKWIERWPDIHSLSKASLEEVNQVWSGLGYYSRGRRLHQAACKVVNELNGEVPNKAELLKKQLPGVGPYTAGAVASIAFNEPVAAVDGNVIRVMSRLRAVGSEVTTKTTIEFIWQLANQLVDPERPGDLNQSLMELGATICMPKSADCHNCPIRHACRSHQRTVTDNVHDIEDVADCRLCLPVDQPGSWRAELGVCNYPRKGKKTAPRPATDQVLVVQRRRAEHSGVQFLMWQRPATGLLANLWEFPSCSVQPDGTGGAGTAQVGQRFAAWLPLDRLRDCHHVTDVWHQFSHISQKYEVYSCLLESPPTDSDVDSGLSLPARYQQFQWLGAADLATAAISTAMRKVWHCVQPPANQSSAKRKRHSR